jgi:hypothetical protein
MSSRKSSRKLSINDSGSVDFSRSNSVKVRQDIEEDKPVLVTFELPNGTEETKEISKYDSFNSILREFHLNPVSYKLVDKRFSDYKIKPHMILADILETKYSGKTFKNIQLKIVKRPLHSKISKSVKSFLKTKRGGKHKKTMRKTYK